MTESAHHPAVDAGLFSGGKVQLTRFGRFVVAAALVAVPLIAGCQEGGDADVSASRAASVSARPAASPSSSADHGKTRVEVLNDARFATKAFGGDLLIHKDPLKRECVIHATALSKDIPGKDELLRIVGRLELRGWQLDGEASMTEGTFLKSGKWSITMGVGPIPDEAKTQASPNTGALAFSATSACTSRTPAPSTS